MAKRLAIPSEELKLRIVGPLGSFDVSRAQRFTMNKDIPSTNIFELGNNTLAGVITDIPNVTITFSIFDVGIKAFAALTGNTSSGYPAEGVDISDLGEVDIVAYVKDATLSDYVKSAHAQRLQIRDFSFNYSVDGESTEEYNLVGSACRWFTNDVIVDTFATGTTSFTLTQTPLVLANGNYGLSVILDGEYLEEVSGAPATGEYRIVGTTLTTGDSRSAQCIAVYRAEPAGPNWSYIGDATMPAAVRGKDVKIVIAANDIPRVQSVTINGNLNVQAVNEMGTRTVVGYQRQVPEVDGTLAVIDTDVELLDLLLNGSIDSGATEFEIGSECVASGIGLEIQIYDPCDDTSVLKTVYIPEIVLTGDSYSSNVNQNAAHTFNWRSNTAECLVFSGSR
jgi:hypothetical protein